MTPAEFSKAAVKCLTSPEGTRDFFSDYAKELIIQHPITDEEVSFIFDMSAKTPYYICHMLFTNAILCDYLGAAKVVADTLPLLMFIAEHWSDVAKPFVES